MQIDILILRFTKLIGDWDWFYFFSIRLDNLVLSSVDLVVGSLHFHRFARWVEI